MSTTLETVSLQRGDRHPINARTALAAAGSTDPVQFSAGSVTVQLTGTATAASFQVERSTDDPADEANWAPAGAALTGDLTSGIYPVVYEETAGAWWRVVATSIGEGEDALIVLSGLGG